MNTLDSMRIDKWLWCARFFKTRSIAAEEISKGRVMVNGQTAKASREVRPGDTVVLRQGPVQRTVTVRALSAQRGPAPVAQLLYEETEESLKKRAQNSEARRFNSQFAPSPERRPDKQERRQLIKVKQY